MASPPSDRAVPTPTVRTPFQKRGDDARTPPPQSNAKDELTGNPDVDYSDVPDLISKEELDKMTETTSRNHHSERQHRPVKISGEESGRLQELATQHSVDARMSKQFGVAKRTCCDRLSAPFTSWKRSYLGIAGGAIGLFTLFFSVALYSTAKPFSIMTQPLSDLGWGPNGSGLAFRIGMGTAATLLIPYMYFVTKSLELLVSKMTKDPDISTAWRLRFSRALRTSYYLSIIAVVCVYMTLIFYDQNGDAFFMHSGCAVIFVTTQTIAIFGYTFVMSLNGRGSVVQMLVACLEIVMALASAAFIIPLFQQYNIIELIKDLFHKTREERIPICIKINTLTWWFPLTEFCTVSLITTWYIVTAVATLLRERRMENKRRSKGVAV